MATSWKSQQGNGEYRLQFETDNEEKYKLVEKAAQMAMDGKTTADVEEVKHSRWENISGFDVCNICGTSPAYCEPKPNNPKGYPPYCHNCGAKMDGGNAE